MNVDEFSMLLATGEDKGDLLMKAIGQGIQEERERIVKWLLSSLGKTVVARAHHRYRCLNESMFIRTEAEVDAAWMSGPDNREIYRKIAAQVVEKLVAEITNGSYLAGTA